MMRLAITALLTFAVPAAAQDRVVSLGGSVTEIVAALGAADRLVARDSTSTFPQGILALPDVGYVRALSAEGVLSMQPTLILAEDGAGPPETMQVLQAASISLVSMPDARTPDGVLAKIAAVADALDLPQEGARLGAEVTRGFAAARAAAATVKTPRRVLFILSLQGGRVMAGGAGTAAEGIITLAGGVNAATGFDGYKPMTDEAVLAAAPDVILMMDREGDQAIGDADIRAQPALAASPAAASVAIVRMDGMLLLGFGPRTPQAALALHAALYDPKG